MATIIIMATIKSSKTLETKNEIEAIENIKDAIKEHLAAVYDSVKDAEVREAEIAE